FPYLGANVVSSTSGAPLLPESTVLDVGGVRLGVVGAATTETPQTTTGSTAGVRFTDPVAAVNRVAATLRDGQDANGEADAVVALFREGGGRWGSSCDVLAHEVGAGGAFGKIVMQTTGGVDALLTAHSHRPYSCPGPVPGQPGRTRPVVQTDPWGEQLALVR